MDTLTKAGTRASFSIEPAALHKLVQWLSPSFPVGAYAYSHGLEFAVETGHVVERASAQDWIFGLLEFGAGWNDGVFLAHSFGAENEVALNDVGELAVAYCANRERYLETMEMGAALAKGIGGVWADNIQAMPYPVVFGAAARMHNIPLAPTLSLYLHSFGANLVSATQRLMPLGQIEGQQIAAEMPPLIERLLPKMLAASLDELGGCAFAGDMASMAHETQRTRLFRT